MAVTALSIHLATLEDVETLLPLVQAYRVFYHQKPDSKGEREFIEGHVRKGTSAIYMAKADGSAAGFMQLFKTYSTVHLCPAWILEDLFVHPEYRHAGVASALLSRALEHARRDGASGMFLETAYDNLAAQALYEKAGWTREGRFLKYNAPLA
jgi:ribosomal protein S18 acetylase RimI-like enzyme